MKHIFFRSNYPLLLLLAFAFLAPGCIQEDLDSCYRLRVTVWNSKGDEITGAGDIADAALFVFNENGKFLEKIKVDQETIKNRQFIVLNYPAGRQLQIVGWGGTLSLEKRQKFSELNAASTMADLTMTVLEQPDGNATPPDKLYFGSEAVSTQGAGEATYEVPIREKMARVMVETEGFEYLKKRYPDVKSAATDGYEVYVKRIPGGCDYKGDALESQVTYHPDNDLNDSGELTSAASNFLPVSDIRAELVKPDGSVDVREADDNNEPFRPVTGETLVIRLIYNEEGTLVSCKTEIKPWGYGKDQIIEF